MENNQRVNEAIERAFAKLFAMSPKELDAKLTKRKIGTIGKVFLERTFLDELPEDRLSKGEDS